MKEEKLLIVKIFWPGMVMQAFNLSTQTREAEAGESLDSKPAWSTK